MKQQENVNLTRAAQERYAEEEVQEQRYQWIKDVVLEIGVNPAFAALRLGSLVGTYDVTAQDAIGFLDRMYLEGINPIGGGGEQEYPQEATQHREIWAILPGHVDDDQDPLYDLKVLMVAARLADLDKQKGAGL